MDLPRLRGVRERQAVTQRELADTSGVAQANISRIESGEQKARLSTVRRLAVALGVAPGDLMAPPDATSAPAGREGTR